MKHIICLGFCLLLLATNKIVAQKKNNVPLYGVVLQPLSNAPAFRLQSFCMGKYVDAAGSNYLFVGGRTTGFHGTDPTSPGFQFPRKYNNTNLIVLTFNNGTVTRTSAALPASLSKDMIDQLSSTNMQFIQNGDNLYIVGGYGKNSDSNFVTYNKMIKIQVSSVVKAVKSGSTISPNYFTDVSTTVDAKSQVALQLTGGDLIQTGQYYNFVGGQNFTGDYTMNSQGVYANAAYKVKFNGTNWTFNSIASDGGIGNDFGQFHRRDLTVAPYAYNANIFAVMLGGVFTPDDNTAYPNPIILSPLSSAPYVIVNNFKQKTNLYDCARFTVYNKAVNGNAITLLGGIGYFAYKNYIAGDSLSPDIGLPFVRNITNIMVNDYNTGGTSFNFYTQYFYEYVTKPEFSLPTFLGSEAKFIPIDKYLYQTSTQQNDEVLDYDLIFANGATSVTVGYMVGGIQSDKAHSDIMNPTYLNGTIYEVILKKNDPDGMFNLITVPDQLRSALKNDITPVKTQFNR
ncbi:hypothetical protein LX64_02630 [Chitinophaga skermanii]|uniref:Delta-60 repeat protein n=1 Tax=Chitinophaga skermanii TaxID=331697 RepID=A0A327QP99_9BACT|nr:hypothetical protein [Chitinophaga skermanii]RAJ05472.1 hypothetical protein LX64_02630 [Chitinophaga skermanii]